MPEPLSPESRASPRRILATVFHSLNPDSCGHICICLGQIHTYVILTLRGPKTTRYVCFLSRWWSTASESCHLSSQGPHRMPMMKAQCIRADHIPMMLYPMQPQQQDSKSCSQTVKPLTPIKVLLCHVRMPTIRHDHDLSAKAHLQGKYIETIQVHMIISPKMIHQIDRPIVN